MHTAVHFVLGHDGAVRFPALLAKSVAAEIATAKIRLPREVQEQVDDAYQRRHLARIRATRKDIPTVNPKEKTVFKPKRSKAEKAAAKSIRKSLFPVARRNGVAAKGISNATAVAVKAAENQAWRHIAALENQLKKSGGGQDSWNVAYQIHRERSKLGALALAKAGLPSFDDFDHVNAYMSGPAQYGAQASRAATASAIAGVQGDAINRPSVSPRNALASIVGDNGEPETLQSFEIQVKKLRKQLADAQTPAERERYGYELTRKHLLLMHAKGEG